MKRWSWASDALIPVGQATVDVLWLYGFVRATETIRPTVLNPSFGFLLALPVAAAFVMRSTMFLPWRFPWNRLVIVPLSVIALLGWLDVLIAGSPWDVRAAVGGAPWDAGPRVTGEILFVGWLAALLLWTRGLWIGLRAPTVAEASGWFLGGMAAFVVLFALVSSAKEVSGEPLAQELRLLIVAFFAVGLTTVALVHAQNVGRAIRQRQPLSLSWSFAAAIPVACVITGGLLLTYGLAPVAQWILQRAADAAFVLWRVVLVLWSIVLWVAYWVNRCLVWLASLFPTHGSEGSSAGPRRVLPPPEWLRWSGDRMHVQLVDPVYVGFAVIVLLAALVVWATLRFARRAAYQEVGEERLSEWSWGLFLSQLQAVLSALLGRLRRDLGARTIAPTPVEKDEDTHLTEIRALYRHLLRFAAERGQARRPSRTPREFGRDLEASWPAAAGAISMVTEPYGDARYGEKAIDGPTLDRARGAVERLLDQVAAGGPKP